MYLTSGGSTGNTPGFNGLHTLQSINPKLLEQVIQRERDDYSKILSILNTLS